MLSKNTNSQSKAEFVIIDELVSDDHLLRKIDEVIDFSFINDLCRPYYCADNGRPAIEPMILFKMLFIGYLFGIRSERRLVEEVKVNVAYRWFLGYGLTDKIPDVSVIWQNRVRRFNGTDVVQQIFDNIVRQAIDLGFVSGEILYSDSTHLKANASKGRFTNEEREITASKYLEDLDDEINKDRVAHGKKPLKEKDAKELHGMRYARMRGRPKVQEQCLLTAAAQNIKKIAMVLARKSSAQSLRSRLLIKVLQLLLRYRKPLPEFAF